MTPVRKRKLIEVSLPLEAINRESAREKSIRHGHPSTLHLWWARRPLAVCRAVLFAQLVDDPSSHPDRFPTERDQALERKRLHDIIEKLVVWENVNDEAVLKEAREEIWKSCDGNPPPILDPFAGGGSIPLEAQRLGLEAHASDLNPVAVLINKALIEIPQKWAGRPPVFPGAAIARIGGWPGATGLAEDVRRYGKWMRDEAEKRIGHLYPKVNVPGQTLPDGTKVSDTEATVIAWIWARTVHCPNPACGIEMPLVRSWWLGKKKGKEAYVVTSVVDGRVEFSIGHDKAKAPTKDNDGTVTRTGAICIGCGDGVPLAYVRAQGKAGHMGAQLMAIAAEGNGRRIYVAPPEDHVKVADVLRPTGVPDTDIPYNPRDLMTPKYGMIKHADLFTCRQLIALTTFSDLVREAFRRSGADAIECGSDGAYGSALATYLAFALSRQADYCSTISTWMPDPKNEGVRNTFARQSIPMTWDFAEVNPFSQSSGNWDAMVRGIARVIEALPAHGAGSSVQLNASAVSASGFVLSTDPPYYSNVIYADLSDYFYIWLRRSIGDIYPNIFGTILTPKEDELVASPFRHGGVRKAEQFFRARFDAVFSRIHDGAPKNLPITVFYAFRQSGSGDEGRTSTGWEVLLEGLIKSGWAILGTWPMRTERDGRMRNFESNALASSILLVCQSREDVAETTDRRGLIAAMRKELPSQLRKLQEGNIAPVDLAQAAIGPGMAVFSRYARVAEPGGSSMRVRTALALINQVLAEVLTNQEADLDSDSRFALKWFEQYGWDAGDSGTADVLARAVNTSVNGLERSGIFMARAGKARLITPEELPVDYAPAGYRRLTVWEVMLHMVRRLEIEGIDAAGQFKAQADARLGNLDAAKELAYLLFAICERRNWSRQAGRFNNLVIAWSDVDAEARRASATRAEQVTLDLTP